MSSTEVMEDEGDEWRDEWRDEGSDESLNDDCEPTELVLWTHEKTDSNCGVD